MINKLLKIEKQKSYFRIGSKFELKTLKLNRLYVIINEIYELKKRIKIMLIFIFKIEIRQGFSY